jgi:phytanoyl-CoA hydroxylase
MSRAVLATKDPIGRPLSVPATVADDPGARFAPEDLAGITRYYGEHGYAVVAGVVPAERCRRANQAFDREAKPDPQPFYRLSGVPEKHRLTSTGFMEDGIRDVQSLWRRRHGDFRQASLDVLTHPAVCDLVTGVLGETPKIVQTMYFEGNPATQPHQDTYYLDGERLGSMVAAWVACEDIAPGAGRFWVCPGSHRIELPGNNGEYNIAEHHDRYLEAVTAAMRATPLEVRAPALATGDVLLWSARTIHGSLATASPDRSRRSFTAHYIPDSSPFLQWQRRVVPLQLTNVSGIDVHHPKDQNRRRHRVRYHIETRLPGPAATAKRVVSARLLRR